MGGCPSSFSRIIYRVRDNKIKEEAIRESYRSDRERRKNAIN